MVSKITIVCFDINNDYEEDFIESLGENIFALECPLRIFDEFLEMNLFLETSKNRRNNSEFKYTFQTNIYEKNVIIEIIVLYDLSYIHNISLEADAYLLFANLEKIQTMSQLEKIITYILQSCNIIIKTYIIGIYKDKIIPNLKKETIELYLEEQNINYEYYQIKNNNKEVIEEYEYSNQILTTNPINENKNKMKSKKKTSLNLIDYILTIMRQVYEIKITDNFEFNNSSKTYDKMSDNNSGCNCMIF